MQLRRLLRNNQGFSLIEVIVGVIIVAIISTASWMVVSVVTKNTEVSRNKATATNLLQFSQEEVRNRAQVEDRSGPEVKRIYDFLETCQFRNSPTAPTDICNFEEVTAKFPGFLRTLTVTQENSSTELKRILVTVNWSELGIPTKIQSVALLSRPPDPLPGNLIGTVTDSKTGNIISGVKIRLVQGGSSHEGYSANALNAKGANFDFLEPSTLKYILEPGDWQLVATHESYEDFTLGDPVTIASDTESREDFSMVALPADAKISGQLIPKDGLPIPNFVNGTINVFEDAVGLTNFPNALSYEYIVKFRNATQRCFTINTAQAYLAGYAYKPSCTGLAYNPDGYSSSIVRTDPATVDCAFSYNGGSGGGPSDPDRVCVDPGEINKIQNIYLDPVPKVTVTGKVVTQAGVPIANATVYSYWPANLGGPPWLNSTVTNGSGNFSLVVPAVQAMFPNGPAGSNYLSLVANGSVQVGACCNQMIFQNRDSNREYVGPLFEGSSPAPVTLTIWEITEDCGNLQGNISDARSGSMITGANVQVVSVDAGTNNGFYSYSCPAAGYRLVTGDHGVQVTHPSYYTFVSWGNDQYNPTAPASVTKDNVATYNGKLWPIGRGRIIGTVRDAATGNPVPDAQISLYLSNGASYSFTTTSTGQFNFDDILENWPPPNLPSGDPTFNYNQLYHSIRVDHPGGFYDSVSEYITDLDNGETLPKDFYLTPKGAF